MDIFINIIQFHIICLSVCVCIAFISAMVSEICSTDKSKIFYNETVEKAPNGPKSQNFNILIII